MMSFGWRPQPSCYSGVYQDSLGNCPKANWFYVLLAAATVLGLSARKKGAGK